MKNTIICQNCKAEIDIDNAIQHRLEEAREEIERAAAHKARRELESKEAEARQLQERLAAMEESQRLKAREAEKIASEREEKARNEAEKQAREKYKREIQIREEELSREREEMRLKIKAEAEKQALEEAKTRIETFEKKLQLQQEEGERLAKERLESEMELDRLKIEMRRQLDEKDRQLKRELEDAAYRAAKQKEEAMGEELEKLAHKLEMTKRDYEQKLADQKKKAEEMVQKAEQGSMERQGEAFEEFIKEQIQFSFPMDEIANVRKGINGADLIHTVRNELMRTCGIMVIEVKRTKTWGPDWIDKLKGDMLKQGTKIGVIVSQTLPPSIKRYDIVDGVHIASYDVAIPVIKSLRLSLKEISDIATTQTGKEEKIEKLYDYITSNDFAQPFTRIITTYEKMRAVLDKEKKQMIRNWNDREKALTEVFEGMHGIYNNIKYIAGDSISLPEYEDEDFDDYEEVDELSGRQEKLLG